MTYQECIEFFYSQLPMYQRSGAAAMKANLDNIRLLSKELANPETKFPSIHIAGTNGKGSSSHLLASIVQSGGYKTGLYTSPHIKDFRERIRIDGKPIPKEQVIQFVNKIQPLLDKIKPSFFELTVAMAFDYFAQQEVDLAIIEVGLGGRLDSTNIIEPIISLITNIEMDHKDLLGNSLESIAMEKAGIIKSKVPIIIGERHTVTDLVFIKRATECNAKIVFAQDKFEIRNQSKSPSCIVDIYENGTLRWKEMEIGLRGPYQRLNLPGVFETVRQLNALDYIINDGNIIEGVKQVVEVTGIKGRWQIIGHNPSVICDIGHNKAAIEYLVKELLEMNKGHLHMVIGFVNDKDIRNILEILPKSASYYYCSANVARSLDATQLFHMAKEFHLSGRVIADPNMALLTARQEAHQDDLIFVGGSTFVVAEINELG